MPTNLPRHEVWRRNYERNRYLEHHDDSVVIDRFKYLIENLSTLIANGKMGVEGTDALGAGLWEAFTHTEHERQLRRLNLPNNFLAAAKIAAPSFPQAAPGQSAYELPVGIHQEGQIFKFGKRIHLDKLLSNGSMRMSAASSFRDSSLSTAAQDDELRKSIYPSTQNITVTLPSGETITGKRLKKFSMTFEQGTDYYVWCLSSRYAQRMYSDFSADACLVIHDQRLFWRRLHEAVSAQMKDWTVMTSAVTYFDPYRDYPKRLFVAMAKHHRYTYQRELRTIVLPKNSRDGLPPLDIVIDIRGIKMDLISA